MKRSLLKLLRQEREFFLSVLCLRRKQIFLSVLCLWHEREFFSLRGEREFFSFSLVFETKTIFFLIFLSVLCLRHEREFFLWEELRFRDDLDNLSNSTTKLNISIWYLMISSCCTICLDCLQRLLLHLNIYFKHEHFQVKRPLIKYSSKQLLWIN